MFCTGVFPVQAQCNTMTHCSTRHSDATILLCTFYLIVAEIVTNCLIVTISGIFVREKINFIPHENQLL